MIGLLTLMSPLAGWAEPAESKSEEDFYQSALQSYLNGDYDQAILMDSKALKINSKSEKAMALLTILASEQETVRKTNIWIGSDRIPAQAVARVASPMVHLRAKAQTPHTVTGGVDSKKMAELEAKIQTIAVLMETDSDSRYKELGAAQVNTNDKLDQLVKKIPSSNGQGFRFFLDLLAISLAGLAFWSSLKTRRIQRRLKDSVAAVTTVEKTREVGKVFDIHHLGGG